MSAGTKDIVALNEPPTDRQLEELFNSIGRDNVFRMVHNHLAHLAKFGPEKYYEAFLSFQHANELSKGEVVLG